MACDEVLLEAALRLAQPIVRLYGWTEPAATFGYFQKYAEVEAMTELRPLIRRPTGGGWFRTLQIGHTALFSPRFIPGIRFRRRRVINGSINGSKPLFRN